MKKKKLYILIYCILILLIILPGIYIFNFFKLKKEIQEERSLLNTIQFNPPQQVSEIFNEKTKIINKQPQTNSDEVPKQTDRILKVQKLKEKNSDIIGWLEIEGTNINYPVLQGSDNKYYMNHNYKKEKSKNGSIFLTSDYDWSIPSSNLLIYGHNLGNGTMFQELLKYANGNFYKEHPSIRFTTTTEDTIYEIISVFKSRVYYKSEKNVFRYYYFVNAQTTEEYNNFIENAKKSSLYYIDKTAKYGDQLMTLSTCSYHVDDGRFAVIARNSMK